MQPDQAPQPNQYDFIMNTGQQAPKSRLPVSLKGGSGKRKIFLVLGLSLFIMLGVLLASSLFGGDKTSSQKLLEIAQEQQEIVRVAGLSAKNARTADAINYAANTTVTVSSSQRQIVAQIGKSAKTDAKTLALKVDSKTDQALNSAAQNNQFDSVFIATLTQKLTAYQKNLRAAYEATSDKKAKASLLNAYNSTGILLGQTKATTTTPN